MYDILAMQFCFLDPILIVGSYLLLCCSFQSSSFLEPILIADSYYLQYSSLQSSSFMEPILIADSHKNDNFDMEFLGCIDSILIVDSYYVIVFQLPIVRFYGANPHCWQLLIYNISAYNQVL